MNQDLEKKIMQRMRIIYEYARNDISRTHIHIIQKTLKTKPYLHE